MTLIVSERQFRKRHLIFKVQRTFLFVVLLLTLARSAAWVPQIPISTRSSKLIIPPYSCLFLERNDNDEAISCDRNYHVRRLHRGCIFLFLSVALFFGGSSLSLMEASANDKAPVGQKYWSIMNEDSSSTAQDRFAANEALLDYAVGMINTQFYDNTGGAFFAPREFYGQWKLLKQIANGEDAPVKRGAIPTDIHLDTREGAVYAMKWLVGSLNDPFSKYLTKEELQQELHSDSHGFLGTGAIVEPPHTYAAHHFSSFFGPQQATFFDTSRNTGLTSLPKRNDHRYKKTLTITRAANLPVVTAVAPDSPAERAGLVVGDRIVAVGDQDFLGWTRSQVDKRLGTKYNQRDYFGQAELTVAKPIYSLASFGGESGFIQMLATNSDSSFPSTAGAQNLPSQEVVLGYRQTRVRIPIAAFSDLLVQASLPRHDIPQPMIVGGDSIVHYQLLTSQSGSIFHNSPSDKAVPDDFKVGYIRLTRFSKASTAGYVQAVKALEDAGAQSYILDLRNNYGGVIQEAMLTASTLLRDPHAVLCYTMNSRGGFTPHDAEEYIVDKRYPGYLLSSEPRTAAIDQVQKENPAMFEGKGIEWDPPSSFASIHEQVTKRGIRRIGRMSDLAALLAKDPVLKAQLQAQKKIVMLINEGTASSAEVFVAALHDNARTVAVVGTKSYGKGLIQHTFPMPDGGGLRLTVAEYLTPSLSHVTNVGGARFDPRTGEFVGGGIQPDIVCESKQGIPGNIRADLCIGVALDALDEASAAESNVERSPFPSSDLIAGISSQLLGNRVKTK